jgi:hypothetical protein
MPKALQIDQKRVIPKRGRPLEFMDGFGYTTIIEFAKSLAYRRGSALDR